MDALILSCSTGGGHNAAGTAIKEELEVRGHHVTMMDPYELVSHKLAEEVGNIYVKMVQHSPKLFGFVYSLGGIVRNIPGKSPVLCEYQGCKEAASVSAEISCGCDIDATSVSCGADYLS